MPEWFSRALYVAASVAVGLFAPNASAELLLHETFDYANASKLSTQVDVAAPGTWWGESFNQTPCCNVVLNGDTGGDNGTASLAVTGIEGTGGRLSSTPIGGDSIVFFRKPVTGEGNSLYISFLYKPKTVGGTTYFLGNSGYRSDASDTYPSWPVDAASIHHSLGRLDTANANSPNAGLALRWRKSGTRATARDVLSVDTTVFVVMKTTMVAGAENDTVDLFISPAIGGPEPAPTVSTSSTPEPGNVDIVPSLGVLGLFVRAGSSGCKFEMDELRAGTTWADVTSPLGRKE